MLQTEDRSGGLHAVTQQQQQHQATTTLQKTPFAIQGNNSTGYVGKSFFVLKRKIRTEYCCFVLNEMIKNIYKKDRFHLVFQPLLINILKYLQI
jgi:hypothetical protein